MFVALACLAWESALTAALVLEAVPARMLATGHLALGLALVLWVFAIRERRDLRFPALLAVATLFTGPFGPAGVLATMGLWSIYRRRATPFDEWYAALFPEEVDDFGERLSRRIAAMERSDGEDDAAGITPLTEVMAMGSDQQRMAVVTLLARDFRPRFTPALKAAMADRNPAIRSQAATVAAQIEDRYVKRADGLAQVVQTRPDDVEARLDLARHYDIYAFAGIHDPERERDTRRQALKLFLSAAELRPEDPSIRLAIGRLLVRDRKFEEAIVWLEGTEREPNTNFATLPWYLEVLFRTGRFTELRNLIREHADDLRDNRDLPTKMSEVVGLWMRDDKAENLKAI